MVTYQQVASAFNSVGLYESAPRRFAVVAGTTALALWAVKPSAMFKLDTKTGKYEGRPMACCGMKDPNAALLSWEAASVLMGLGAVLIL